LLAIQLVHAVDPNHSNGRILQVLEVGIAKMLQVLDFLLFVTHCIIISFNLTGWIWKCTRRWHLVSVGLTVFSWLGMGMWYGLGYCVLTDWHWQVKRELGEVHLPNSFLVYLFNDIMGLGLGMDFIDMGAGISLATVVVLSVVLNFRDYKQRMMQ